jgi:hypothetical protein
LPADIVSNIFRYLNADKKSCTHSCHLRSTVKCCACSDTRPFLTWYAGKYGRRTIREEYYCFLCKRQAGAHRLYKNYASEVHKRVRPIKFQNDGTKPQRLSVRDYLAHQEQQLQWLPIRRRLAALLAPHGKSEPTANWLESP